MPNANAGPPSTHAYGVGSMPARHVHPPIIGNGLPIKMRSGVSSRLQSAQIWVLLILHVELRSCKRSKQLQQLQPCYEI